MVERCRSAAPAEACVNCGWHGYPSGDTSGCSAGENGRNASKDEETPYHLRRPLRYSTARCPVLCGPRGLSARGANGTRLAYGSRIPDPPEHHSQRESEDKPFQEPEKAADPGAQYPRKQEPHQCTEKVDGA